MMFDRDEGWRRGRDSNPRYPCEYAAFRVRCFQPLSHLSTSRRGAALRGPLSEARNLTIRPRWRKRGEGAPAGWAAMGPLDRRQSPCGGAGPGCWPRRREEPVMAEARRIALVPLALAAGLAACAPSAHPG